LSELEGKLELSEHISIWDTLDDASLALLRRLPKIVKRFVIGGGEGGGGPRSPEEGGCDGGECRYDLRCCLNLLKIVQVVVEH
jgi:hypothetical protein